MTDANTDAIGTAPLPHSTITVDGLAMAVVDLPADPGAKPGRTLVFQHGNPKLVFPPTQVLYQIGDGPCEASEGSRV